VSSLLRSPAVLGVAALLALGAAQRVWNVLHYPVFMGFDAQGNWAYIELLLQKWALPAPDAGWSTAHPPLFYALGAGLGRLTGASDAESVGRPLALLSAAVGLAAIAATAWLVRRHAGGSVRRTVLAAALLVFLPVHVAMSTMLSEELLTSALVTFAVVGLAAETSRPEAQRGWLRPALFGALAGLALLTKLSAAMAVGVGGLVLLAEAPRRGGARAVRTALAFGLAAALTGGWFYALNLVRHGYLYPHGLSAHAVMFEMPPGERGLGDYVRFPAAAFSAAQAAEPALLRSVWGATYASLWFDPHRHFLPKQAPGLELAARVLLLTALVPTAAFAVGLLRGVRRAWRERSATDRLLAGLVVLMLGGYVAFTLRNPWFVTVKGSFLLGLATPFACYASEALEGWLAAGRMRALAIGAALLVLFATSLVTFTYQGLFEKWEPPGAEWRSVRP
jgi:4-amino-4-deoxy-L-arabinose transferase-like glycosyltransferase